MAIKRTRNEYKFGTMSAFRARSSKAADRRKAKGPGRCRGLSKSNRTMRSVPRDDRATPVEAVDELAADRLHVLLGVLEANRRPDGPGKESETGLLVAIRREAVLGFPE